MKKEFLIESPHTKEECLQAMDEVMAMGDKTLAMYKWGCASGDHRAWAFVMADSEAEAMDMVPKVVSEKTKITEVKILTPKEIKSYHE